MFVFFAAGVVAALSVVFLLDPLAPPLELEEETRARAEVVPIADGATGPESLAFDPAGEGPYTGVSDGRILKWQQRDHGWIEYAVVSPVYLSEECRGSHDPEREHLCGRPLGLKFDEKTGNLYIADAYLGLLMVAPNQKFAQPVVTQAEGHPLKFTNSLDIDHDNETIYFTDSSMRFQRRDYMLAVIAGDNSGRLMKYDVRTKEVQVLLRGLHFPNGVLLSEDGSYLLVAETITCRILKYWLRPPAKAGLVEVHVQLPGFPDNVKRSPRGGFWVAMHSRRGKPLELLMTLPPPRLRELLVRLPFGLNRIPSLVSGRTARSLAVRIGEDGEVLEAMGGFGSKEVRLISEVEERDGTLWIGSVVKPFVGVYKVSEHVEHVNM